MSARVASIKNPLPRPAPGGRRPRRPAPPGTTAPELTVVIVNFRQAEGTAALVRQLERSDCFRRGSAEIVLVDNDADPGRLRQLLPPRSGVTLREFGRNRGFARAVNEGCRRGRGEWLLLLNPDVRVPERFLDRVLTSAERLSRRDPGVGVVGYQLRHSDDSPQGSFGPFPTLANVVGGLLRPRGDRRCRFGGPERRPVPWVTGCCLLVRRACWLDLDGFDEDFFLYYEDVDLCRRARAGGWSVWYEPAVRVTHEKPLHVRSVPPELRLITRHALLTYAAKHWPRWQFLTLAAFVRLEAAARRRFTVGTASACFARLAELTADLIRGRAVRARRRLLDASKYL